MGNLDDENPLREIIVNYFTEREQEDTDSEEEEATEEPEGMTKSRDRETPTSTQHAGPSSAEPGAAEREHLEVEATDENCDSDEEGYAPIRHLADEVFPETTSWDHSEPEPLPTCDCKLNDGQPCYTRFKQEDLISMRLQCLEMTRRELDISTLSKLSVLMSTSPFIPRAKHKKGERRAQKTEYRHGNFRICWDIFKYLHAIGQDKLNSLFVHFKASGVEARVHKLARRRPHNALQYSKTRMVVDFIVSYAEVHAISLPGCTPYHWKDNVKLLPANCTKKTVYTQYAAAATAANVRVVAYDTFRRIWLEALPFISVLRPATDLCWVCQQGAAHLATLQGSRNARKTLFHQEMLNHISQANKVRFAER